MKKIFAFLFSAMILVSFDSLPPPAFPDVGYEQFQITNNEDLAAVAAKETVFFPDREMEMIQDRFNQRQGSGIQYAPLIETDEDNYEAPLLPEPDKQPAKDMDVGWRI